MIVDKQYHAITQDQIDKEGVFAKLFTLHQNYKGVTDWHENNITFKVFQASGFQNYTEKNYYLSNFKGNNDESQIQFYDLDRVKGSLECRYILNGTDIDVYVKGARAGVPAKLQIIQAPRIGTITFHQRRGWESFDEDTLATMIKAETTPQFYLFSPVSFGQYFFIADANKSAYKEYSIDRDTVTIKATLSVNTTNFKGDGNIFTIPQEFTPAWCYSDTQDYVTFTQDFGYKPSGQSREFGKCRVMIYKDGRVEVAGMKEITSGDSADLYLNLQYKRQIGSIV